MALLSVVACGFLARRARSFRFAAARNGFGFLSAVRMGQGQTGAATRKVYSTLHSIFDPGPWRISTYALGAAL